MDGGVTEREKRFHRREMLRKDYELTRGTEKVERTKQRDRNIDMAQLNEFQRQREEVIKAQREEKQKKEELKRNKEEHVTRWQQEVHDSRTLEKRGTESELELQRMRETAIDIDYDDDVVLQGACGYDYRMDCSKMNTESGQSLITVGEYGQVDEIRKHLDILSKGSSASIDTVDRELNWLKQKTMAMQEDVTQFVHSEDRIKRESGKDNTYDHQLIKRDRQDESGYDDIEHLQKQIELMKLKENEISKAIERKARIKELKERGRLREEKDRQYTERVRALKQQKRDLEQSLLEKQSVLCSLDDELIEPSYHQHKSSTHRKKTTDKQEYMPFMIKPNVPKFSDPA
ncbi:hypothetical protein DPMN_132774 [Dreissena polymorpha]|uniref:Uncharacterized protein n=1 Tax=Dreissena polymorpha TaxID=45954 RepID=A0A9D4JE55_DREPO|nr:hypothetical protein DPMN_132774 [Dreissena polymorpha]